MTDLRKKYISGIYRIADVRTLKVVFVGCSSKISANTLNEKVKIFQIIDKQADSRNYLLEVNTEFPASPAIQKKFCLWYQPVFNYVNYKNISGLELPELKSMAWCGFPSENDALTDSQNRKNVIAQLKKYSFFNDSMLNPESGDDTIREYFSQMINQAYTLFGLKNYDEAFCKADVQ